MTIHNHKEYREAQADLRIIDRMMVTASETEYMLLLVQKEEILFELSKYERENYGLREPVEPMDDAQFGYIY